MESAFGTNFSHVRLHNDSNAAHISSSQNARALTVGKHVAFGAGEYQPGTMLGDALIAHELAHVVQQSGAAESVANMEAGKAGYEALEKDADETAVGAITSLWGKSAQTLQEIQQQAMPSLRSGLRLQRCNNDKSQQSKPSSTKPTAKTGSFAEKMTPFKTGVSGTIEFTPDPKNCPVCSKIRLVQIVQVFEKPGEDYKWPGSEAGRENVKTTEDKKKGIKPNFFVDHQAANCTAGGKCSIYYRDHWANPSASQDGSNNGTTAKKATLWDKPTGDADDIFNFETCARCDATGTYLRAFNWGFTADSSGNVTKNATSEQASPSATFIATVAKFDKYYGN
jgi:hypothetical protein